MINDTRKIVSVIIPIYNVEKYLEKCLESIINNTYKNLEIICVNDGSPDNSLAILKKFADQDSRIIIIDQINQGVAAARNNGLKAAHGEYIAFVDSDDYVHKQYFETLVHCMDTTGADAAVCNAVRVKPEESVSERYFRHIHYKRLSANQFFRSYYARHMVWSRLYKKEVLEGHSFCSSVRTSDDTLFNLEVMRSTKNPLVYETDTGLYYYLQRDDSIVNSTSYLRLKDISDYYLKYLSGKKINQEAWSWMLLMQVIKSALSYRYMIRYRPDVQLLTREVNKALRIHLKEMMNYDGPSKIEKTKHWIMYLFPELYRRFRIMDDPSMLEWEKNEKRINQKKMKQQLDLNNKGLKLPIPPKDCLHFAFAISTCSYKRKNRAIYL